MQSELDELVWSLPPALFPDEFRERCMRRSVRLFQYVKDRALQYGAFNAKLIQINMRASADKRDALRGLTVHYHRVALNYEAAKTMLETYHEINRFF